jgi:multidrug efflux pump subunit AcrA (membrane-fusion protein)
MVRAESSPLTSKQRGKRRRRRNVTIAIAAAVALCAAGGGVAYATTRGTTVDYRTATAATGDVTETVSLSGTVASVNRRDAAFQVAGTVSAINVAVGQKVAAGDTLATMDPASLTAAVTKAQQAVTQATQTLADDLASQTAAASSSASTKSTTTTTATQSGQSSAAASAIQSATTAVTAAQQKLLAQYTVASDSLTTTEGLVTSSAPSCQPFLDATLADPAAQAPASTPTPTPTLTATPGSLDDAKQALAACQTAVNGVLTSQQATTAAQKEVQTLAGALNDAIAALTKALQGSASGGASTGASTPSSQGATASAPSGSASGSASGGSTVASAATILADEATITAANAQLSIAQNGQALGTLTSPIAGTVAAVAITPGSAVTAGSSTEVITVIGDGGFVVNATASLTNVTKLKMKQPVEVSVAGSSNKLAGTVSSIGLSNVSTSSTTTSYAVTVAVTDKNATMLNGAAAQMAITANTASSVLTVPTSAIHRTATSYTVDVLKDGNSIPTTVKVGASGTERTEISSGITKGTVVILADISSTTIGTATPTTSTTGLTGLGQSSTTTGRPGGFTGRPGGGAPAGG